MTDRQLGGVRTLSAHVRTDRGLRGAQEGVREEFGDVLSYFGLALALLLTRTREATAIVAAPLEGLRRSEQSSNK